MVETLITGFKSAFTWQMVGQTIGQLIIATGVVILVCIIVIIIQLSD